MWTGWVECPSLAAKRSCEDGVVRDGEERLVRKRQTGLFVLVGALLLALGAGVAIAQGVSTATAELEDTDGNPVGNANFTEGPGGVTIAVEGKDMPSGEHGIHVHEKSDISSSDFKSAGEHHNPTDDKHGFNNPEGPHAGDLENINVAEDGTVSYTTTTDRITLSKGERSILDSDGSSLIIHDKADDYETDPSGESGDRIAAGEIKGSKTGEPLPKSGGSATLLPTVFGISAVAAVGMAVLIRRLRHA